MQPCRPAGRSADRTLSDEAHEVPLSGRPERNDVVPNLRRPLHARRAGGHARHRQASGVRRFGQQPPHCDSWYVTFDNVTLRFRRVAGRQPVGYLEPPPDRTQFAGSSTATSNPAFRTCATQPAQQPQFGSYGQAWSAPRSRGANGAQAPTQPSRAIELLLARIIFPNFLRFRLSLRTLTTLPWFYKAPHI